MYYNHIRVQLARSKLLDEVNMEKKLNKKLTKNVHWNMLRLAFRITFTVLYCTDFLLSESYISPSIFSYLLRQIPTLFILMVKNSLAVNRTICYHFIYIYTGLSRRVVDSNMCCFYQIGVASLKSWICLVRSPSPRAPPLPVFLPPAPTRWPRRRSSRLRACPTTWEPATCAPRRARAAKRRGWAHLVATHIVHSCSHTVVAAEV